MHFDEHTCSSSRTFVLRGVDCSDTSFRAWQSIHNVTAVIFWLDKTWIIVLAVVVAVTVAIDNGNMASLGAVLKLVEKLSSSLSMTWAVLMGAVQALSALTWQHCEMQGVV